MAIIGAILGDIAGSKWEFNRPKDLDYEHIELFQDDSYYTDDTVLSVATKYALENEVSFKDAYNEFGNDYIDCGYGDRFFEWLIFKSKKPYKSCGNGSAMRVSPVIDFAKSREYPAGSYYKYPVSMSMKELREVYRWDETCQGSVPAAIRCFLDSEDYESFIRNVLSFKCDSDTLGAIGGGIAEAFYKGTGFNNDELLKKYLDEKLYGIVKESK